MRPVTVGCVPEAAVYGPPGVQQTLGGLPVVASFLDQLGVAAIIDGLCPIRDVALATHGQVIEAMIANRLTSPTPLVRVIDRAREWAAGHCFGITPEVLNDDRLGRALDAIAPELDQIAGTVGMAATQQFGLDVSRVHWDMTSISLYGACPEADQEYATPKFGHPKDRRPDLKQIQTGIGTSADGGIPVYHRACDGGAAEVSQVTGAMTALKDRGGRRRLVCAAGQSGCRPRRRRRGADPFQRPGSIRTPLRDLQGAPGSRAAVLEAQPAYRGPDHRDLPGLAGVLPHRTPHPRPDRPADHDPRPIRGAARPPHRLADLPRTGRDAAHPCYREPASGH